MLVNLKTIFEYANEKGIAVGAFNCTNLESIMAIIKASEKLNSPVIISYAEGAHSEFISFDDIGEIMVLCAKKSSVPVCVHYDHGESVEKCMKAIKLGFSSVMIDASNMPFEENIRITKQVVDIAHTMDITVEAELGNILLGSGGEGGVSKDSALDLDKIYTNPDMAKEFVLRTNVDALAIAFGTAHGIYETKPILDLDRIAKIKDKIDIPLVMHGGSGLSKEEFQTAIKNGVRKINFYTYMSLSAATEVEKFIKEKNSNVFYHELSLLATNVMQDKVMEHIDIFSLKK